MSRPLLALILLLGFAAPVWAHEVRPAYLEITERTDGKADILWKQPSKGLLAVALAPRVSGGLTGRTPDRVEAATNFEIRRWLGADLQGKGLDGRVVRIDGLDRTITDTLVLVNLRNGNQVQQILTPAAPAFTINARSGATVPAYLMLGIEHILTGIDHLLFVFGLVPGLVLINLPLSVVTSGLTLPQTGRRGRVA